MRHWFGVVTDENDRYVNGALVKVYASSAVATGSGDNLAVTGMLQAIYSDDGVTLIDQGAGVFLMTDKLGWAEFWANASTVVLAFEFGGKVKRVITDVELDGSGSGGGGTLTTTGSPAAGNLAVFSSSSSLSNGDLSGDVTTSGSLVTTIGAGKVTRAKIANAGANSVLLGSGASGSGSSYSEITLNATLTMSGTALTVDLTHANTWTGKQTLSGGADLTPASTPATNAVGYLGCPQNIQNANYTTVMSDSGKHIYHTSGSAHTYTIDSNANVAYPIGTILTFQNGNAAGNVTLAITSDTLRYGSLTGSRTLAANSRATALKVASTEWQLDGVLT